jgi:hypothetical protein
MRNDRDKYMQADSFAMSAFHCPKRVRYIPLCFIQSIFLELIGAGWYICSPFIKWGNSLGYSFFKPLPYENSIYFIG